MPLVDEKTSGDRRICLGQCADNPFKIRESCHRRAAQRDNTNNNDDDDDDDAPAQLRLRTTSEGGCA